MRKNFSRIVLVLVFFYVPVLAMCWGQLGHRIVAQIADSHLSKKAKSHIKKILGHESIAMVSNWPDFIKSDTAFKYLDTWHYINFEKGLTYERLQEALAKDTAGVHDAYTAIVFLSNQLRDKNLPLEKQQMYLKLLVHIVGDVHQPLHVSPEGSTGGNAIKVQWFGENSNLHRVWDSDLIEMQQLSYTEYADFLNHTTKAERKQLQQEPVSKWLYDSYVIAEDLHDEINDNNTRLGYRYNYDHIQTLNRQLLVGGIHLAGLLNDIFRK